MPIFDTLFRNHRAPAASKQAGAKPQPSGVARSAALALLLAGAATVAAPAAASAPMGFERPFPAHAKRAALTPGPYPTILLDGKRRSLAAGGKIWGEENRLEMPASLRGSGIAVNYTENAQGEIDRVWILSEEESRRPPPDMGRQAQP